MTVFHNLGDALRHLRTSRGLSQKSVAKSAGVTAPMLSSYETGRTTPEVETLDKVLDGLGASLSDLEWALRQVNERPMDGENPSRRHHPAWRTTGALSASELTDNAQLTASLPRVLEEGYSEIFQGLLRINRFVLESVARSTLTSAAPDEGTTHRE